MDKYDSIIVHGAGLNLDDPKSMGAQRANTAISLYEAGFSKNLVLTGTPEETEVMKAYCLERGIDESDIYLSDCFESIGSNFNTKKNILEPNNWNKNIFVSSYWHEPRLEFIKQQVLGNGYETEFIPAYDPRKSREVRKDKIREFFYYILDKIAIMDVKEEQIPRQVKKLRHMRNLQRFLPF